jgi:glutamine amidotransferase
MNVKVTIVDYGAGNLHSAEKAFARLGADVELVEEPKGVDAAHCLVLPGVGAYGEGMAGLERRGLIDPLRNYAASGRPLLGICLGAQLLMEESEEFGSHAGLGLIPGHVRRLPEGKEKIPHVGWTRIYPPEETTWKGTLLEETPAQTWTYFVHSFQCHPTQPEHLLARASYGTQEVTAAVRSGSVLGLQFHPEKSGVAGLAMLRRFLETLPADA